MNVIGIVLLILLICLLGTVFVIFLIYKSPFERCEPIDNLRIGFILSRCRYHREVLKAYHQELCDYHAVHPHSNEGDFLFHVVYDGEPYDPST
jgi:hypothetical protein